MFPLWKNRCQEQIEMTNTPWLDDVDMKLLTVLFAYQKHDINVVEAYQKHVETLLSKNSNSSQVTNEARSALWLAICMLVFCDLGFRRFYGSIFFSTC
jgi:hypothetical protein